MTALGDICPPAVVRQVLTADLAAEENHDLFDWIFETATADCGLAALPAIARRLDDASHPRVVEAFASAVADFARFLPREAIATITEAFRRIPFSEEIAPTCFLALRKTGIDIRPLLKGRIAEDWSFAVPDANATTWYYYLYLASLGEPGALDALAGKIARTEDGQTVWIMLQSLNNLPGDAVTAVLRRYADDPRPLVGVHGPTSAVGKVLAVLLRSR